MTNKYLKIKTVAEELATEAGKYLLSTQKAAVTTKQKDILDICTTADLGSEKILIEGIHKNFPYHSIISEEAGTLDYDNEFRWIIDPLDGTKEYVRNVPQYNVSIAVEHKGKLVVSVIYRPTDQTLYSAALGAGAYKNGERIYVSLTSNLRESFLYCYLPSYQRNPTDYNPSWNKLMTLGKSCYRLRSFADENTALCWLAQGGHEGYLNLGNPPKWHDIAPGLFIALTAGAYIHPDTMNKIRNQQKCSIIVCNNQNTLNQINNILLEYHDAIHT